MHTISSPAVRIASRQAAPLRRSRSLWLVAFCVAATWFAGSTMSFAQVSVTPTITFSMTTGLFTYSYSVTNGSTNTLAIISFGAQPTGTITVQNLSAPTGFLATYDSGNGFISFLEDNNPGTPQTFAPGSTIAPFVFNSPFAPGNTTFQALDVNGNTFTGITQAPIPEPGTLALCALALPFGFYLHRRRKSQRRAPFVV